jgi:hypothetical protein
MEVSGKFHILSASPPGKARPLPIEQGAGCNLEPVWNFWRREKFSFSQEMNYNVSVVQPIAQSLHQLHNNTNKQMQ